MIEIKWTKICEQSSSAGSVGDHVGEHLAGLHVLEGFHVSIASETYKNTTEVATGGVARPGFERRCPTSNSKATTTRAPTEANRCSTGPQGLTIPFRDSRST